MRRGLDEFGSALVATYQSGDLIGLYLLMNYVGKMGEIRRAMIHEIFKDRNDMNLTYNPHPSFKGGIWANNMCKGKGRAVCIGL